MSLKNDDFYIGFLPLFLPPPFLCRPVFLIIWEIEQKGFL